MRLKYCKLPHGNFSDDLTIELWPMLFPDLEAKHPEMWLYGIGTILGGTRPDETKVVLGSGCGYCGHPKLDDSWRVYWVRGPGTAKKCGLDPELGQGDAAVLWPPLRSMPAGTWNTPASRASNPAANHSRCASSPQPICPRARKPSASTKTRPCTCE